jgi:SPP1 family predicted phage head-tail adaptor
MRQRIILQERVIAPAPPYGEPVESWQDVTPLNASVEPLKGQEFFKGSDVPQKVAEVDTRMRIRYRKGMDPAKHRIVYDGIVHDLVAVIHDRRHNQTQLMVKAIAVQQADGGKVNV